MSGEAGQATAELLAIAALIERPPLDDVLLKQGVAARLATAIVTVVEALAATEREQDTGEVAQLPDVDEAAVERGAKALFYAACDWDDPFSWEALPDYGRDYQRDRARACLSAAFLTEGLATA